VASEQTPGSDSTPAPDGPSEQGGSQGGWYAAGGAIAAAGITVWSVGFAKSPTSKGLEFLGLIAFVIGLAIIVFAMPSRRTTGKTKSSHAHFSVLYSLRTLTAVAGVLVIAVGGFFIFSGQHSKSRTNRSSATSAGQGSLPVLYTCAGKPVIRPSSYILGCATGQVLLTSLNWSTWTASQATGTGQLSEDNCEPSCADGTFENTPVQVTLSELDENTANTSTYFVRLIMVGNGGEFPITYQLGQNGAGA
jgi:hypothetical protein